MSVVGLTRQSSGAQTHTLKHIHETRIFHLNPKKILLNKFLSDAQVHITLARHRHRMSSVFRESLGVKLPIKVVNFIF